jgi:hypothetical protein
VLLPLVDRAWAPFMARCTLLDKPVTPVWPAPAAAAAGRTLAAACSRSLSLMPLGRVSR